MLLYLHIPYCASKCPYCAFNSFAGRHDAAKYMVALRQQLVYELERFGATAGSIETLYIGGGTPSTVAPEHYAPVLDTVRPWLRDGAEITAEANPNSATSDWLRGMHDLGVNRLSFGVQSFDPAKLKTLGRTHTPKAAIRAIRTAAEIGYAHLSLDLIYNVAGDTEAQLKRDIDTAMSLPIDHLSAYELTLEANTPFAATPHLRQENDTLAFFVADTIQAHGFEHYEISNFGMHPSQHNLGYWQLHNYIGAGAGAVGFRGLTSNDSSRSDESFAGLTPFELTSLTEYGIRSTEYGTTHLATRYYPQTNIDAYIQNPLAIREEHLAADDLLTERIFLGLRSRVGIERRILPASIRTRADLLVRESKLTATETHYHNPNLFLADEIALFLVS